MAATFKQGSAMRHWVFATGIFFSAFAPQAFAQLCRVADGILPDELAAASAIGSDGNQFVLITNDNRLHTSDDGLTWTERLVQSGIGSVYNLKWTGLEFVGMRGRPIMVSPDGITWEDETPNPDFNVVGIAWDGTQTVAAGNFANALNLSVRPNDGNWSAINYGTPSALADIVWDGTQFIAGGSGGLILTSPDAVVWTERDLDTTVAVGNIVTDGVLTMAMAGSTPFVSTDGVTWVEGNSPGVSVSELIWDGQFIAGGIDFNTSLAAVSVSDDGVNWEMRTVDVLDSRVIEMASNGDRVLAVTQRLFQNGPPNRFVELGSCNDVLIFADDFESRPGL